MTRSQRDTTHGTRARIALKARIICIIKPGIVVIRHHAQIRQITATAAVAVIEELIGGRVGEGRSRAARIATATAAIHEVHLRHASVGSGHGCGHIELIVATGLRRAE